MVHRWYLCGCGGSFPGADTLQIAQRTVQDILEHAEVLAKRFEDYQPSPGDERDPEVFAELARVVLSRSDAERSIRDSVQHAREHGHSWAFVGSLLGTSGEAARQRYGHKQDA